MDVQQRKRGGILKSKIWYHISMLCPTEENGWQWKGHAIFCTFLNNTLLNPEEIMIHCNYKLLEEGFISAVGKLFDK